MTEAVFTFKQSDWTIGEVFEQFNTFDFFVAAITRHTMQHTYPNIYCYTDG